MIAFTLWRLGWRILAFVLRIRIKFKIDFLQNLLNQDRGIRELIHGQILELRHAVANLVIPQVLIYSERQTSKKH